MKTLQIFIILVGGFQALRSEQASMPTRNVKGPGQISEDNASGLAPKNTIIKFQVLTSRTQHMVVTEASEMSDLPPVKGAINVTVQLVKDPGLVDPEPLPVLKLNDPTVLARMGELQGANQDTQLIFLSATVYGHSRTLLRISPNGKPESEVSAWSNIDFNHFSGFSTFSVPSAKGAAKEIGLLMGLGNEEIDPSLKAIKLQDLAKSGPAFVVSEGAKGGEAIDLLTQLHSLYRTEGKQMAEAYAAREKAYADRKAYLIAQPPKLQDVTMRFWKRRQPTAAAVEQFKKTPLP